MIQKHYVRNSDKYVVYYSNYSILDQRRKFKCAVILIHGTERNAQEYYDTFRQLLIDLNLEEETLLICPHFKVEGDCINKDELFWSDSGWKQGNNSQNKDGTKRFSSFSVIDSLIFKIELLGDVEIKVIGHSAGGQFVNRYCIFGNHSELFINFYPMNASSYLYFEDTIPYKYGLKDLNTYCEKALELLDDRGVAARIKHQNVYVGEEDTLVEDNLDTDAEAMKQGANRLERAENYCKYIREKFQNSYFGVGELTYPTIVENVGHSKTRMLNSVEFIMDFLRSYRNFEDY